MCSQLRLTFRLDSAALDKDGGEEVKNISAEGTGYVRALNKSMDT